MYRQHIAVEFEFADIGMVDAAVPRIVLLSSVGARLLPLDANPSGPHSRLASRRPIDFQDVTPHEFAQAAIQRGTPPEQAHFIERLNDVLRAGRAGFVTDDVENITGTAPGTFRDWCERNVDAFR